MYKLIAFDLDGTLLNDEKTVNRRNLQVIRKLQEDGIEIVIATGRGYMSAKNLIRDIEGDLICIGNNGTIVRNLKDNKLIDAKHMEIEDIIKLVKIGDRFKLDPIIHINEFDNGYDVMIRELENRSTNKVRLSTSDLRMRQVGEFGKDNLTTALQIAYFDRKKDLTRMHEETFKMGKGRFNSHILTNVDSAEAILEYLPMNVSKWSTLKDYAKSQGISPKEIISFGDDNNDKEMLTMSGLGIAMKNANNTIKSISDIVTEEDNNADGIYQELVRIFDLYK